jgi:hypothetical protein
MVCYAITAVRVDELGRISHAVMDQVESRDPGSLPWWAGNPMEYAADDVAEMLESGVRVETIFIINSVPEFGSSVKCVAYDDGMVGIELATETEGRTYRDLIQLGE